MRDKIRSRIADRLRPTRIIQAERMLDLRFAVALSLVVAAKVLAGLVGALGLVALIACGVLVMTAVSIWFWRPTVIRAYIPFEHYEWQEYIALRIAGRNTFDCLCCRRRLARPEHLEVTRCRCGAAYGAMGAGLYVRWASEATDE